MGEANGKTDRLAALQSRERAMHQAVAEERVRQRQLKEKKYARLAAIVDAALLEEAARVADFELLLRQTLKKAIKDEKAAKFLTEMGWL